MCGIFGWLGRPPTEPPQIFNKLERLLQHRGPDDSGFEYGQGWGLGFRRLSILDLNLSGHQPMSTHDGRFWIAFNGEIYNYLELRRDLEARGVHFYSSSDTEVLLHILATQGPNGFGRLNGMFALAIVDTQERTFILARDRLGVKPLYYSFQDGQLRFASELKALLAWPCASRTMDPTALVEYLALNYLSNETCIFQNYHKLPPAHLMVGDLDDPDRARLYPYWQLEINGQDGPAVLTEQEMEETADLLQDAVSIRLRSDVPVGVFLSGGLDSGLVASLASCDSKGQPPLALTVGFAEEAFDETNLARLTAQAAGLDHRVIPLPDSSLTDIDRLAWYYYEPFGDSSALPTFNLCETAAGYATVFLSGDGGDEAFAGYRWYIRGQDYQWYADLPLISHHLANIVAPIFPPFSKSRYRLLKLGLPDNGFAAAFDLIPNDPAVEFILTDDFKPYFQQIGATIWRRWEITAGRTLTARQQALDYSLYLPDDILVKMDRASMAHSIEVRSPFLDYRLVERVAQWPRAAMVNTKEGKLPLRTLGKKLLPQAVQQGVKRGFGIPLDQWFQAPEGQALTRRRLLSTQSQQKGLWDLKAVEQLLQRHASGKGRRFGSLLWRLLFLEAWSRYYLDGNLFLGGPEWKPAESVQN